MPARQLALSNCAKKINANQKRKKKQSHTQNVKYI